MNLFLIKMINKNCVMLNDIGYNIEILVEKLIIHNIIAINPNRSEKKNKTLILFIN